MKSLKSSFIIYLNFLNKRYLLYCTASSFYLERKKICKKLLISLLYTFWHPLSFLNTFPDISHKFSFLNRKFFDIFWQHILQINPRSLKSAKYNPCQN